MKFTERAVRIGLILMVGISFYLTYLIWLSPSNEDVLLENNSDNEVVDNVNHREMTEVYLPLHVVRLQNDTVRETNTESFVRKMQEQLPKLTTETDHFQKIEQSEAFAKQTHIQNGVELTYLSDMPLKDYLKIFQLTISKDKQLPNRWAFFTVQVDFDSSQLRFINTQTQEIFSMKITAGLSAIEQALQDNHAEWIDMFYNDNLLPKQYYTNHAIQLKKYSYIASSRPYTIFRDAFFTNPKDIRSSNGTMNLNLYDGSESMIVQQNEQKIEFSGTIPLTTSFSDYQAGYKYIRGLGTNYGSMRLFDQRKQTTDYRVFVEGFPIFSQDNEGEITVQLVKDTEEDEVDVAIHANLNTIQVPIPSDETVELPASYDAVQQLYVNGAKADKLTRIIVGYTWKNLPNTEVVDLEPNWYVQYEDQWYSFEDLMKQLTESEEN